MYREPCVFPLVIVKILRLAPFQLNMALLYENCATLFMFMAIISLFTLKVFTVAPLIEGSESDSHLKPRSCIPRCLLLSHKLLAMAEEVRKSANSYQLPSQSLQPGYCLRRLCWSGWPVAWRHHISTPYNDEHAVSEYRSPVCRYEFSQCCSRLSFVLLHRASETGACK